LLVYYILYTIYDFCSVGIVTRLWTRRPRNRGSISVRRRRFLSYLILKFSIPRILVHETLHQYSNQMYCAFCVLSSHSVAALGSSLSSIQWTPRVLFWGQGGWGVKLITHCEREEYVDLLYVFTSPHVVMAWYLIERIFL